MSLPDSMESIDTTRVNAFFIWRNLYQSFIEAFNRDSYGLVNCPSVMASEYLLQLKGYASQNDEVDQAWKGLSEVMEVVELPNTLNMLRQLYRRLMTFNHTVDDEIVRLKRVPNLEKQHSAQLRLHDFVTELIGYRQAFMTEQVEILDYVQSQLFKSLNRSEMELRLLKSVNDQYQTLYLNRVPEFNLLKAVEQGDMARFDLTYARFQDTIYTLLDELKVFKTTANIVADIDLNYAIYESMQAVQRLTELGLLVTKQPSYSIERFKSGRMGADVFEVVKQINVQVLTVQETFFSFENRIIELMSDDVTNASMLPV